MRRRLVEVVPSIYGGLANRKLFLIDVPALVRRAGLPDAPSTRDYLARAGLRRLRRELPGVVLIAKMCGVQRG
jgi:hypothetical protein